METIGYHDSHWIVGAWRVQSGLFCEGGGGVGIVYSRRSDGQDSIFLDDEEQQLEL